MDIGRTSRTHVPPWMLTSSTLLIVCLAGPLNAQQTCAPSEKELVQQSVEACVQMLREETSGPSHPEYLKPVEDAIGGGAVSTATGYNEFNVGDAKFSAEFTHCIRLADPAYAGSATSGVDLPVVRADQDVPARYEYTNKYQIHRLRDRQKKIVYDLIRIPEGHIEAMGTWVSDKPASYNFSSDCKNSNGDPCGTKYMRNRVGSYEKL